MSIADVIMGGFVAVAVLLGFFLDASNRSIREVNHDRGRAWEER